jgi:phosphopantetheinyl transferase
LSARERAQSKVRPDQRKYAEWLAGRIAAKDAVRRYLFERGHGDIYPVEIEIANDPKGRPHAYGPFEEDLRISITHKDSYAAAAVSVGVDCGIDIERVESRDEGFKGLAFTTEELELLPDQSPEWLTRLWTAKEAVGKSLGTGMAGDPRTLRLSKVENMNLMVNDRWAATQQLGEYILSWTLE